MTRDTIHITAHEQSRHKPAPGVPKDPVGWLRITLTFLRCVMSPWQVADNMPPRDGLASIINVHMSMDVEGDWCVHCSGSLLHTEGMTRRHEPREGLDAAHVGGTVVSTFRTLAFSHRRNS